MNQVVSWKTRRTVCSINLPIHPSIHPSLMVTILCIYSMTATVGSPYKEQNLFFSLWQVSKRQYYPYKQHRHLLELGICRRHSVLWFFPRISSVVQSKFCDWGLHIEHRNRWQLNTSPGPSDFRRMRVL